MTFMKLGLKLTLTINSDWVEIQNLSKRSDVPSSLSLDYPRTSSLKLSSILIYSWSPVQE